MHPVSDVTSECRRDEVTKTISTDTVSTSTGIRDDRGMILILCNGGRVVVMQEVSKT